MRRKKREKRSGRRSFACIIILLIIVMSVQIVKLYQKDQEYIRTEEELNAVYESETERKEQISDYEEYIGSREYVEDTARSRLGMIYDNETIFREK